MLASAPHQEGDAEEEEKDGGTEGGRWRIRCLFNYFSPLLINRWTRAGIKP